MKSEFLCFSSIGYFRITCNLVTVYMHINGIGWPGFVWCVCFAKVKFERYKR